MTNANDLRPITATEARKPIGPVLLLPVMTIWNTDPTCTHRLPIPPLERLRTTVRNGHCDDCGATWPAIDDHVRMPVFRLDHQAGCAAVARFEQWLARSGIPGGFAAVRGKSSRWRCGPKPAPRGATNERNGLMGVYERNEARYLKLRKGGASLDEIAAEIIADERKAVESAEMAVDPDDRAQVEKVVRYGAGELNVPMPRVRFFKSAGLDIGGIVFASHPNEIWVAGDRLLHEQARLGLHELAHTEHLVNGLRASCASATPSDSPTAAGTGSSDYGNEEQRNEDRQHRADRPAHLRQPVPPSRTPGADL